MKKIWLLTTLLIGSLLLIGCKNQQYEEEFSEYWLLQWPNGTITIKDFEKEWNILIELNIEKCSSPEKACVPVIFKEDGKLYTPSEYNETPFDNEKDRYTYYTDLETFRKVTWLKEASPEYVEWGVNTYFFDPYVKFYKTREEKESLIKNIEPNIIDESKNNGNEFIDWFTWNIINWSDWKSYVITWDNTLYYNDNYWFAMKLWKEWNWAKIEIWKWCEECTETEYPHHIMIELQKPKVKEDWPMDWYWIITFSIVNKTEYEKIIELSKWDPMCDEACIKYTIIWHNNKYYFHLDYTNMGSSDVYDLFEWQLDCKLNYLEDSEWNHPWLPRDCSEALPKIVPEYHFYSIMSNLPSILDD